MPREEGLVDERREVGGGRLNQCLNSSRVSMQTVARDTVFCTSCGCGAVASQAD